MPNIDSVDIVSWQISSSVYQGVQATLVVNNDHGNYDANMLQQQVSIDVTVNAVTTTLFLGWIISQEPDETIGGDALVTFNCGSFILPLDRKPINTEFYSTITAKALLDEIAGTYGSLDSSLYDFTSPASLASFNFENILVSESSLLQSLKMLAEAAQVEIFVNNSGALVTEDFVVAGSGSIYDIPSNLIAKASKTSSNEDVFSRIRVRGRFKTLLELGSYIGSESATMPGSGSTDVQEIAFSGVTDNEVFIDATFFTDDDTITADFTSLTETPGSVILTFTKIGGSFSGEMVTVYAFGAGAFDSAANSFGNSTPPVIKNTNSKLLGAVHKFSNVNPPTYSAGSIRSLKYMDEKEEGRFDVYVDDASLISEVGVRWEEVDNVYIPSAAQCVIVGTRKFVEFKQRRRTWTLECAFDENVVVNAKVRFTPPEGASVITGVVRSVDWSYNVSNASLLMRIVVEDTLT